LESKRPEAYAIACLGIVVALVGIAGLAMLYSGLARLERTVNNKIAVLDNKITVLDNKIAVLDNKFSGLEVQLAFMNNTLQAIAKDVQSLKSERQTVLEALNHSLVSIDSGSRSGVYVTVGDGAQKLDGVLTAGHNFFRVSDWRAKNRSAFPLFTFQEKLLHIARDKLHAWHPCEGGSRDIAFVPLSGRLKRVPPGLRPVPLCAEPLHVLQRLLGGSMRVVWGTGEPALVALEATLMEDLGDGLWRPDAQGGPGFSGSPLLYPREACVAAVHVGSQYGSEPQR